jgi:putative flippase GtrA
MRPPMESLVRFAVVGVASNVALYLAYVGLTLAGIGPKLAMTICFVAGVLFSFVLNRNWSFKSAGPTGGAFLRYALTYVAGYLLNLGGLLVFVDGWGFPHQIVQACLIAIVAVLMFAAQRVWVFRPPPDDLRSPSTHVLP